MAYIGRGTDSISNVEVLDNITFNGNSSYTLQKGGANFVPVSANNILLSIDGVVQANNFSVSGSTIDFGTAVTGNCNFVLHFGTGLITTVQDGAVTTVKIGDDAVTYAKLQNLATANRVLGSTSTGLIGETQIATAMVSDDAITYAKMQDTSAANRVLGAASAGTIGEVQIATDMIADAQVDESKLKISNTPTNGYFLSAQSGNTGGLTWAEAGGGEWTIILHTTASNVSQVAFNSTYITNTYQDYKIVFSNIHPASDNVYFNSYYSDDNGSSRLAIDACLRGYKDDGTLSTRNDNSGDDYLRLQTNETMGNDTGLSIGGFVELIAPFKNDTKTYIFGRSLTNIGDSQLAFFHNMFGAGTQGYTALNHIKFSFSSGNITSGEFTLYGRKIT